MKTYFQRSMILFALLLLAPWIPRAAADPADYSVYPHLDHTEYLDGASYAVESYTLWSRDFFAVANENSDLHLYEVVGGTVVPLGIGQTVGDDRDVVIKGWHAFVATVSGLSSVNVAVPESPFRTDFLNLAGEPVRLDASATHAFVACGSAGLVVVDISDPQNLSLVGSYGSSVRAVCLDGDRLGIVNEDQFEILDVTVPAAPVLLGSIDIDIWQSNIDVVLQGDVAYASRWWAVTQLDVSDPGAITATKDLPIASSSYGHRMEIRGAELFYAGGRSLTFADFATGTVTRISGQVGLIRDAAVIAGKIVAGGEDRVAFFEDGLHAHPPTGDVPNSILMEPRGIILDNLLFGLSRSAPTMLVATELGAGGGLLWNLDLGTTIRGMAQRGTTLVTLTPTGDLSLVTVSRHGAILRSTLNLPGNFYTPYNQDRTVAFLDDQTLVVLDERYGGGSGPRNIRVVDISNPGQPVQIGQYNLIVENNGLPEHVMVAGTKVVVTCPGGYEVFDAQDRLSLQSLAYHSLNITGNTSAQVQARDSWLYVFIDTPVSHIGEVGPERLDTWDISDPVTPALVSQLNLASPGHLVYSGDWAYQGDSGLILDFSDPANPVPAGNFSQPPAPNVRWVRIYASGEFVVEDHVLNGDNLGSFAHFLAAQGATGAISAVEESLPKPGYGLTLQAVPNPFNPRVSLLFDLPEASLTRLEIFDLRGRLVADLGEKFRQAGPQSATWDGVDRQGQDLPSGVYLARVLTPKSAASKKIVLAR